jgi:hypothetical protein
VQWPGVEENGDVVSTIVIICFAAIGVTVIAQFVYAIWEYESHHRPGGERRSDESPSHLRHR